MNRLEAVLAKEYVVASELLALPERDKQRLEEMITYMEVGAEFHVNEEWLEVEELEIRETEIIAIVKCKGPTAWEDAEALVNQLRKHGFQARLLEDHGDSEKAFIEVILQPSTRMHLHRNDLFNEQ